MNSSSPLPQGILHSSDPRVKLIAAKIRKAHHQPDALIEILHTAQNTFGYLPHDVLVYITKALRLPPSRVYATATFYHFFSLKPKGEHTCMVCTGTACYVKGAQLILHEVSKAFDTNPGQVSKDNQLGLQVARCIGACGLAPAVVIDNEVQGNMTADAVIGLIHQKLQQP